MPMHSLIHPNRSGCLKMRATDATGSGSGGTASVTAWQPESELAQLQTEVFAVTGVKVSADDPIMAVLVIQKRDMQAYIAELTRRQDEQQDIFTCRLQNAGAGSVPSRRKPGQTTAADCEYRTQSE